MVSRIPVPMLEKDIREGRRAGIPERIIGKLEKGLTPTKYEKEIIKKHGKVFIPRYLKRVKGRVVGGVRPQLRDLPR